MTRLEEIIFWLTAATLAYVYAGYPLLVWIVGRLFPRDVIPSSIEPKVTVLITAFNEEAAIRAKLENTLAIDYSQEKLEILVASDGSTDTTDEIVKEFAGRGVTLFRQEGRVGKTATQNNAIQQASGEIILFSDATTLYSTDVFAHVLPPFADESIGCVAGRLIYVDEAETSVGRGTQNYWSYETLIKTAESRACSLIGASGCLYAVRKSAYEPMYAEACSDFLICTNLYRSNYRSVFAPEAVCYESTNRNADDEMRMRIRVISQTLNDLWRNRDMLNPAKSGFFAIELISHKVLRYAVPVLLAGMLFTSLALATTSLIYAVAAITQLAFYAAAFLGFILERLNKRSTVFAMPLYFVLTNLAIVAAFYKTLRGEKYATWQPIRPAKETP